MAGQAARVMRSKERQRSREEPAAPAEQALETTLEAETSRQTQANDNRRGWRAAYGGEAEHAVFLVPGLLGFENFSSFRYFGDRVVAALRSGLEARLGSRVPVVALPIPPTASIAERQRHLVRSLADRLHRLEHGHKALKVHLVGHSTGGVDANLLTHARPRGASSWSEIDSRAGILRDRIRSVVSIASPLQGTCITRDPIARLLSDRDPRGVPALLRLLGLFAVSSIKDVELADFAASSLHELRKTARFVAELSKRWALLSDLEPSNSIDIDGLKKGVVRRSFVTITGRAKLGDASVTPPDSFFRALSERAEGWKTGCAEEGEHVIASVARLKRALTQTAHNDNALVLRAPGIELPDLLDAGHNDGVVNSARQLLNPDDPEELAAIVVADHFDVVGYYDRYIWKSDAPGLLGEDQTQVLSGLLHSGCNFRDDQLFELYHRVADVIASTVHTSQPS
jgi:pimeloyl-ACP methyl ester carboxylesterase